MRRIAVIALLVLPIALVLGWRIWTRAPALVVSLRNLPEVAKVEYTGSANAPLVVVHFLDWSGGGGWASLSKRSSNGVCVRRSRGARQVGHSVER
jgi:hypothetical protein